MPPLYRVSWSISTMSLLEGSFPASSAERNNPRSLQSWYRASEAAFVHKFPRCFRFLWWKENTLGCHPHPTMSWPCESSFILTNESQILSVKKIVYTSLCNILSLKYAQREMVKLWRYVRCQVPTRACSWCCRSNWTSSRDPFSSTRWTLGLCLPSQVFQSWQKSEWFVISLIIPKCILNIDFTWEQTVPDSELKFFQNYGCKDL